MRASSTTAIHSATAVVPSLSWDHPDDVAEVHAEEEFRLRVRFVDGTEGLVDLAALISSSDAGVFAELRDPEVFAAVRVAQGTVTWPGDIDLAPDSMYAAIRETGRWVL